MLLFLLLTTVVELVGVAAATTAVDEIGEASLFGRAGTIAVTLAAAVIAGAGAVVTWRQVGGAPRAVTAVLLFAAAAVVLTLTISLLTSANLAAGFAAGLLPAFVWILLIGRAVLRTSAAGR
ncbi:hypothetical protein [Actinoplanes sp. L3-i22]|uniref:hypothetical protein n=1 Tax=Actinoplanes sp. L3-i22 TaxID=2836373 RepID=UPI001C85F612|nr:hypothetical protein [Actinoplanes sp. L3-i22]